MSNFDIDFGPWINYGNANKGDEIGSKMQDLITKEWSPFNGHDMAKVFIFCMAYGFAKKMTPKSPPGSGSLPASAFDQEMRNYMKFVAIASMDNLDVITNANKVVKICQGYAYASFLEVYGKLANRNSSIKPETILETLIQDASTKPDENSKNDETNSVE